MHLQLAKETYRAHQFYIIAARNENVGEENQSDPSIGSVFIGRGFIREADAVL